MAEYDYSDRATLVELYHERDLNMETVAEMCDVTATTTSRWIDRHDIPAKPRKQDLARDIRRVCGDRAPTQSEYQDRGRYGANTAQRRFGSWNAALEAAGYDPRTEFFEIGEAELIEELERLAEELGRSPSQKDIDERGEYAFHTYYNTFDGGMQEAKRRAGLELYQQNTWIERVELDCDGPGCSETVEKRPVEAESTEFHYCSRTCMWKHYCERYEGRGNPRSTLNSEECEVCGSEVLRADWEVERSEMFFCDNDCYADWCSSVRTGENHPVWEEYPTRECEWCGATYKVKPSLVDESRFCSMDCLHSWKTDAYRNEGNPNWIGGRDQYMGPNWEEQRLKALVRDQARCQGDACDMTDADHLREQGRSLHVHHITPREAYRDEDGNLDYQEANKIPNLIPLCTSCHGRAEGSNQQVIQ